MTYGHFLDRAAQALRGTYDAVGHGRVSGHGDAAATIDARARLYHGLTRITELLGGRTQIGQRTLGAADLLINTRRRAAAAGPAGVIGTGLRAAILGTEPRIAEPVGGVVARGLHQAAEAVAGAADVLVGHVGGGIRPARTPEGRAIAMGAGRDGGLADIARVALAAVEVDRRLPRWLLGRGTDPTLRPLHEASVQRMRWWTDGNYPAALHEIVAGAVGESILRRLDVAPATELSTGPRPVTTISHIAAVLDTARAWMMQHPAEVTFGHVVAGTRLAVTTAAAYVLLYGADHPAAQDATQLDRWRAVAAYLPRFTGLHGTDPNVVVQELDAASELLRRQIRARPAASAGGNRTVELARIVGLLPGLADTLHGGVKAMAGRVADGPPSRLYVRGPAMGLESTPRRGVFYARHKWRAARVHHDEVEALLDRLHRAAAGTPQTALVHAWAGPVALSRQAYPSTVAAIAEVAAAVNRDTATPIVPSGHTGSPTAAQLARQDEAPGASITSSTQGPTARTPPPRESTTATTRSGRTR